MYDLYLTDFCVRQNVAKPITAQNYREIFVTEYNFKCFTPKQDQCSTCNAYYHGSTAYKKDVHAAWESHKLREKEAMQSKCIDNKTQ